MEQQDDKQARENEVPEENAVKFYANMFFYFIGNYSVMFQKSKKRSARMRPDACMMEQ